MSHWIQALEPRRLLSVNPAVANDLPTLVSDGQSILVSLFGLHSSIVADGKATNSALRGLSHTAQNRSLISAFRTAQQQWVNTLLVSDWHALLRAGLATGKRAAKDGTTLTNSGYTNPIVATRLLNDLKTLQSRATPPLNKLLADVPKVNASLTGALSALASANPSAASLQTSVATETSDLNSAQSTLQSDASTAQADVATVISDLSS